MSSARMHHVTDHPVGDHGIGHVGVAGLVDERDRDAAEPVGPLLGGAYPAGVRRDDREVLTGVGVRDVPG
jgi:hypothetical protein